MTCSSITRLLLFLLPQQIFVRGVTHLGLYSEYSSALHENPVKIKFATDQSDVGTLGVQASRSNWYPHHGMASGSGYGPDIPAQDEVFPPPAMPFMKGKFGLPHLLWSILIQTVLLTLFAYWYIGNKDWPVVDKTLALEVETFYVQWQSGLCDCIDEPDICITAWCCPCVRWADTMSMLGLVGFWGGVYIYFILFILSSQIGAFLGSGVSFLAWVCVAVYLGTYRQRLRAAMGMQVGGESFANDVCVYCFCAPCAIAQEARHVEEAATAGHPALQPPTAEFVV